MWLLTLLEEEVFSYVGMVGGNLHIWETCISPPSPPTLYMAAWNVLKIKSHQYTDSLAQKPQLAPCCLWTKAFSKL